MWSNLGVKVGSWNDRSEERILRVAWIINTDVRIMQRCVMHWIVSKVR